MFETVHLTPIGRLNIAGVASAWPRSDAALHWLVMDTPPGGTVFARSDDLAASQGHRISNQVGLDPSGSPRLAITPDGSRIVFLYQSTASWLAPADSPKAVQSLPLGQLARAFGLRQDGHVMAAWLGDNHLKLFDLDHRQTVFGVPDVGNVMSLQFAGKADSLLLARQSDGRTAVFDAGNGIRGGMLGTPAGRAVALDAIASEYAV